MNYMHESTLRDYNTRPNRQTDRRLRVFTFDSPVDFTNCADKMLTKMHLVGELRLVVKG